MDILQAHQRTGRNANRLRLQCVIYVMLRFESVIDEDHTVFEFVIVETLLRLINFVSMRTVTSETSNKLIRFSLLTHSHLSHD